MTRIRTAAAGILAAAALAIGATGVAASTHVLDINEDHGSASSTDASTATTQHMSRLEAINDDNATPDAAGDSQDSATRSPEPTDTPEAEHSTSTESATETESEHGDNSTSTSTETQSSETETENQTEQSSSTSTESSSTESGGSGGGSGGGGGSDG